MTSLLDSALAAATAIAQTPDSSVGKRTEVSLSIDLVGAHASVDRRLSKSWATHLWADSTWQGNRSAGFSLKGSF